MSNYNIIRNFIYLVFIGLVIFSCNRTIDNKPINEKSITPVQKIKVVFVLANPNIDVNTMNIDDITDKILNDSILQIESISKELYIKTQIVRVYKVEDITCEYLKKRFKDNLPGELVYEYNGKVLIKLNDGVIKVYHSHEKK